MNTSQDTPGFDATREALVFYCPTTPAAATKFLTTLEPRNFEALVTAARSGRNQEQTRALVLVAVAEIAACQALQIAALAGMGVGRLAAEHSVDGRPAEHVNQACELASKALDAAFDAREAVKAALAAQDQAERAAIATAEAAAPHPAPVAPPPVAPAAVQAPPRETVPASPPAPAATPPAPSPEAEPQQATASEPASAGPQTDAPVVSETTPAAEPAAIVPPVEAPPQPAPSKPPKRPTLSG